LLECLSWPLTKLSWYKRRKDSVPDAPQRLRVGHMEGFACVEIASRSSCTMYQSEENSDFA
jgi:hypothetical protein